MISRRIRWLVAATATVVLLMAGAPPAAPESPVHVRDTFSGEVSDAGEACGDPLSWEFTGEVLITRFFDDGVLTRIQVHVQESGTVTNLATGEVVELPRTAFLERVLR